MSSPDGFQALLRAAQTYEKEHNIAPTWISGWDIDDERITPPAWLEERIAALPPRLADYVYINAVYETKEYVASSLCNLITIEGKRLQPQNVAVVPSSTQALLLILTAYRDFLKLQELHILAPSYFACAEIAEHLRLDPIVVSTASYFSAQLPFHWAREAGSNLSRKAVILTNPAYGVGVERTAQDLTTFFASIPHNTPILCDETALGLSWDDRGAWDPIDLPHNVTLIRSPSKVFFMHGRKFSFVVSSPATIEHIEALSECLVGSIDSSVSDSAGVYLDGIASWHNEVKTGVDGPWRIWKRNILRQLRKNLQLIGSILEESGFELSPINSGYYVLAGQNRENFGAIDSQEVLRRSGVVYTWSDGFHHNSPSEKGFRVNLAGNARKIEAALNQSLPLMLKRAV